MAQLIISTDDQGNEISRALVETTDTVIASSDNIDNQIGQLQQVIDELQSKCSSIQLQIDDLNALKTQLFPVDTSGATKIKLSSSSSDPVIIPA